MTSRGMCFTSKNTLMIPPRKRRSKHQSSHYVEIPRSKMLGCGVFFFGLLKETANGEERWEIFSTWKIQAGQLTKNQAGDIVQVGNFFRSFF